MEAGGVAFREVQFEGPDSTNIVLLELLDKQLAQPAYSLAGYAAVGPVVTVVADASAEEAFYVNLLGLDRVASGLLTGSDIEQACLLSFGPLQEKHTHPGAPARRTLAPCTSHRPWGCPKEPASTTAC